MTHIIPSLWCQPWFYSAGLTFNNKEDAYGAGPSISARNLNRRGGVPAIHKFRVPRVMLSGEAQHSWPGKCLAPTIACRALTALLITLLSTIKLYIP